MPNFEDNSVQDFVLGDTFQIFRTVTKLPTGRTVVKAWFTLKPNDSDDSADDAAKIFQKEITSIEVVGIGQVIDPGSGSGDARQYRVRFDINPDDTFALDQGVEYPWDIQVKLDNDWINTPFKGKLKGLHGVTNKTS